MAVATGAVVLGVLDAEDESDFPRAVCRAIHDHLHDVRRVSMGQHHPRLRRYRASYWPPMRPEVEQRLLTSYRADLTLHPHLQGGDRDADDVVTWHDQPPDHPFFRTSLYREFYLPQGVTDQLSVAARGVLARDLGGSRGRLLHRHREGPAPDGTTLPGVDLPPAVRVPPGGGAPLRGVDPDRRRPERCGRRVRRPGGPADPSTGRPRSPTCRGGRTSGPALEQDVVLHGSTTSQVRTVVSGDTTLVVEQSLLYDPVIHLLGHPEKPAATAARRLTRRQVDVARLLVDGRSAREIAGHLQISLATARSHIEHVYRRLEVTNRAQAVAMLLTSAELE